MDKIVIKTEYIQLDQLMKWAGITGTGGQVKALLEEKLIYINNIQAFERRKKIRPGDIVEVKGIGQWIVATEE